MTQERFVPPVSREWPIMAELCGLLDAARRQSKGSQQRDLEEYSLRIPAQEEKCISFGIPFGPGNFVTRLYRECPLETATQFFRVSFELHLCLVRFSAKHGPAQKRVRFFYFKVARCNWASTLFCGCFPGKACPFARSQVVSECLL